MRDFDNQRENQGHLHQQRLAGQCDAGTRCPMAIAPHAWWHRRRLDVTLEESKRLKIGSKVTYADRFHKYRGVVEYVDLRYVHIHFDYGRGFMPRQTAEIWAREAMGPISRGWKS
jgi:hypothetical protein